jgi:predicted nucleotidyltransferase
VEILERIRTAVAASPDEVVAVYLYGSYARDTATAGSDIDLGLLLTAPPEPKLGNVLREVEAAIEERLGRQVEAVALNRAAPDLVHRVLRDGVILLDRDRSARIKFEVRARNEYFDLAPLRSLYRRVPA